jgi:dephospho-CoA kinase
VVTTTQTQQVERLKDRDGTGHDEALRIVSSQMPTEEKLKFADYVIQNEGSLEETKKRAKEIFKDLKKVAQHKKGHQAHRLN